MLEVQTLVLNIPNQSELFYAIPEHFLLHSLFKMEKERQTDRKTTILTVQGLVNS